MSIIKGFLSSGRRSGFITSNIMDYGEVYTIQHYVIKFVCDKSVVYFTYSNSCCNKRPFTTGHPTPRLYGKFKFWNYCKLEVQVNLYHAKNKCDCNSHIFHLLNCKKKNSNTELTSSTNPIHQICSVRNAGRGIKVI